MHTQCYINIIFFPTSYEKMVLKIVALPHFWKMCLKQHSKLSCGAFWMMQWIYSSQETLLPMRGNRNSRSQSVHRGCETSVTSAGAVAEVLAVRKRQRCLSKHEILKCCWDYTWEIYAIAQWMFCCRNCLAFGEPSYPCNLGNSNIGEHVGKHQPVEESCSSFCSLGKLE